jgi:reductive dehalogenase
VRTFAFVILTIVNKMTATSNQDNSLNEVDYRKTIDNETGFQVNHKFKRFNQKNEIYCRSEWDESRKSKVADSFFQGYYMPNARSRKTDGFSQRDYALRNAAWHVTNILRDIHRETDGRKEGFFDPFSSHDTGWPEPYPFDSAEEATENIRKVAKFSGADLVGICEYDERWIYAETFCDQTKQGKASELPDDLPYVIVTGEAMDRDLTKTVPSALSGSATGMGYGYDALTLLTLAQYIRNLGYRAYATMNDSALAVPLAVQAGLGEVGRHGLLITEEFGPRLRLGKIFTDLPLSISKPKHFGVTEFCENCDRCAKACPPKAIPTGVQDDNVLNRSNISGIVKWTTDAEKCFDFWANQNTDCSICIRTCPYNRDPNTWHHKIWLKLAGSRFRKFALWLDDKLIDRGRHKARWWWSR